MVDKRTTKNDRIWKLGKQAARRCSKNFKTKIKEKKKKLTAKFITESLKCSPFFLGCYAMDLTSKLIDENLLRHHP